MPTSRIRRHEDTADLVELVDTLASKTGAFGCGGSSPPVGMEDKNMDWFLPIIGAIKHDAWPIAFVCVAWIIKKGFDAGMTAELEKIKLDQMHREANKILDGQP